MNILLISLAILPGLAICWYIFHLDKYEKENPWHLILCFILGMVIIYPTMLLEDGAVHLGWNLNQSLLGVLFYALVGVALIEELMKTVCVFIYPYHRPFFNEPMDGIVYSVMIGMGFATLENIIYATTFGLETTLVRAFTAVPAHGLFATITGYYIGLAKFDPANRIKLIATGLGLAVLLHGIYDFFLLQELYGWLSVFAIVTLMGSYLFAKRLVQLHIYNSPFKETVNDITNKTTTDVGISANTDVRPAKDWDDEIGNLLDEQEKEGL